MPSRAIPSGSEPHDVPNNVTTMAKIPPSTLKKFLTDGIEQPECSICGDTYGGKHVAIQIKECGHQLGKHCLEKWLKQKNTEGTCPLCRDVLFRATPPPTQSLMEESLLATLAAAAPFPPDNFAEYYEVSERLQRSATRGFMQALWYALYYLDRPTGRPSLQDVSGAIIQAFEVTNWASAPEQPTRPVDPSFDPSISDLPEHWILSPHVYRIRHNDFSFPDECTVTGFANTVFKFIILSKNDECPPPVTWRAMFCYHGFHRDAYPVLSWPALREATWSLGDLHSEGRAGDYQWSLLQLFFYLICWHTTKSALELEDCSPGEVVALLKALDLGFPDDVIETRDVKTHIFVHAACQVMKTSRRKELSTEAERNERLVALDTGLDQLKHDVEELWLEAISFAARKIADEFSGS
jgi:hypothetical protein